MVGEQLIDIVHVHFVHVLHHFNTEGLAEVLIGGDFNDATVGRTYVHQVGGLEVLQAELGAEEARAVL